MKRSIELSQEKGASLWLTALPLVKHGFVLYKSDFHDAISIRYNWTQPRMPTDGVRMWTKLQHITLYRLSHQLLFQ
jgi:hypothetical protein